MTVMKENISILLMPRGYNDIKHHVLRSPHWSWKKLVIKIGGNSVVAPQTQRCCPTGRTGLPVAFIGIGSGNEGKEIVQEIVPVVVYGEPMKSLIRMYLDGVFDAVIVVVVVRREEWMDGFNGEVFLWLFRLWTPLNRNWAFFINNDINVTQAYRTPLSSRQWLWRRFSRFSLPR